jgi:6-phosphogluconolactonase
MSTKQFNLIIGSYTTASGNDIAVYRFYTENGGLAELGGISDVQNASFICVAPNGRFIYAVNEIEGQNPGYVTALAFEPTSGELKLINRQPVMGIGPCYITVNNAQNQVFIANYASGSLSVLPLDKDGSLLPVVQTLKHEGAGPDCQRQEQPHVHSVRLSPDEKFLLVADLGTDKLCMYHYLPENALPLSEAEQFPVSVQPGHGPRHFEFSRNKRFMYLITEMGGYIYVYDYKGAQSILLQTISVVAEGFEGAISDADIHMSPDGRFLYASNRGDANGIVVFSVDTEAGSLTFVERKPSIGKGPRNFALDPTGNYLFVANENSDDIYVYEINKHAGTLKLTDLKIIIGRPACLKFTTIC